MPKANPLPGEAKGGRILDIAKLLARFGEELCLDFGEWSEATSNFTRFQTSRDKDGDGGSFAKFWSNHFGFFDQQEDKIEMYPYWMAVELRLRNAYRSQPTTFDRSYYAGQYDQAKLKKEFAEEMEQYNSEADPHDFSGREES